MRQEEIELYAFMYFCGVRDRRLLMGKEEMSFSDFDRLLYIAGCLKLEYFGLKLWNQHISRFEEHFQKLEYVSSMRDDDVDGVILEDEFQLKETWLSEFCENTPNIEAQKYLQELMKVWE